MGITRKDAKTFGRLVLVGAAAGLVFAQLGAIVLGEPAMVWNGLKLPIELVFMTDDTVLQFIGWRGGLALIVGLWPGLVHGLIAGFGVGAALGVVLTMGKEVQE